MIRIDSGWKLIWIANLVSDWFGFIRIDVSELIGLSRIGFWPFFIKRDTKRFSDWFGIIRTGSDTDIGMNRNSSDWLGMNFNPILSSGLSRKRTKYLIISLLIYFFILLFKRQENLWVCNFICQYNLTFIEKLLHLLIIYWFIWSQWTDT